MLKKQAISLCFAVAFFLASLVAPAQAKVLQPGDPGVRISKFYIGQKYYDINGTRYTMDVAPYVKSGRTLLPMRYVGYALGLPDKNIIWSNTVTGGTATLRRDYVREGRPFFDEFQVKPKSTVITLNGWDRWGRLDVPAETIPPGRIMLPFRAAVQALGGLCFWNGTEQSVTIVTWEKAPNPVPQTVTKVEATQNKAEATVTYLDGTRKTITCAQPPNIGFETGYILNTVEWLKAWGIPEEAMLMDPVRGGLAVRGAALSKGFYDGRPSASYVYFYVGDKQLYDSFGQRDPKKDLYKYSAFEIEDGKFLAGAAAAGAPNALFGGSFEYDWTSDKSTLIAQFK